MRAISEIILVFVTAATSFVAFFFLLDILANFLR